LLKYHRKSPFENLHQWLIRLNHVDDEIENGGFVHQLPAAVHHPQIFLASRSRVGLYSLALTELGFARLGPYGLRSLLPKQTAFSGQSPARLPAQPGLGREETLGRSLPSNCEKWSPRPYG